MSGSSPPGFFAGSDEEDQAISLSVTDDAYESEPVPPSRLQTPTKTPATSPLFLTASDEDEAEENHSSPPPNVARKLVVDDEDGVEEVLSSTLTTILQGIRSCDMAPSNLGGPSIKNRLSPGSEPPLKKRRLSPGAEPHLQSPPFPPTYLGDVLVENAWSTVSGKGYVKSGDPVIIRRDGPDDGHPSSSARKGNGAKKTGGKKQISITSMLKPQTTKLAKRKIDTVVRITNQRGFDFARLPTEVATWMSQLLDLGLVEVRGTMTDCPEKLSTGLGIMVTLHIYILYEAFKPLRLANEEEGSGFAFNEGYETQEESYLRERKAAILKLFNVTGLRPQTGAKAKSKGYNQKYEDAIDGLAKRKPGKTKKEVVGDGEEIEVDATEELSNNDLSLIYQKAQQGDSRMPMMEPAESFNLTLRGYQKQALKWMFSVEHGGNESRRITSMHPLWSQYTFPPEPNFNLGSIDLTDDEKIFYFNPYSGELSLVMPKAERRCQGGILADGAVYFPFFLMCFTEEMLCRFSQRVMGMGKTIMISALIQSSQLSKEETEQDEPVQSRTRQLRIDKAFRPNSHQLRKNSPPSATLIVAPTSLLGQWAEEIQRSSKPGTLKVIIWHGQNRLDLGALVGDGSQDGTTPKVVITSYGTLASEHVKSYKSSIFDIYWLRIVLDEAHNCKSRTSKTAKATYDLHARWRWAVTGTPIVNKLEDLHSLLRFLNHKPWSEYSYFRSFITLPFLARDPKAIEIVQVILESILLRREKNMLDIDGKRIVELPPKMTLIERLEFSSLERKIYDSIYLNIKQTYDRLEAKGLVGKNYTHLLALLMKLRRAVLHPSLVLEQQDPSLGSSRTRTLDVDDLVKTFTTDAGGSEKSNAAFAEGILANLAEDEAVECPICFDVMENPTIIPDCAHRSCKDCILTHITTCEERGQQPNCFACGRGPIKANELLEVVRKESTSSQPGVVLRRNDFQSSTKLDALLRHLRRLKEEDPVFRAVVFSQFTSYMDLIQATLKREKYDYYRFDGTMDVKKKSAAIAAFKAPSEQPKVLIISLKAGGVGLNLTTANHVFMMDCWWNAATENQAIDRVHRIGQEKTVHVTHFIVSDTIEDRILQIQKRKMAIVHEAFRGGGKETQSDPQSIENLKIMFEKDK